MSKKSTQVALGGVCASLCLALMFLTGIIPFATYALPAIAGLVLVAVVIENGYTTAVTVYVAAAILSLFIVPDKEAALMFTAFFGYYPILKGKLERIKSGLLRIPLKFLIFNAAVVAAYSVIIFLFGITDVLDEMGSLGKYAPLALLGLGNVMFAVYDFALTQVIFVYIHIFRPKILRRFQ